MLKAILEGKAGRITAENGENQSWRDVFKLREDLLTAVFFSRIRYLSEVGELKVLSLLIGDEAAHQLGEIYRYKFWPKLYGLEGRSFVEPDVLIVCENALVLIEVKPPFGGSQYSAQWRNEIESLLLQEDTDDAEWDELPDNIYFIALGNNAKSWKSDSTALQSEYAEYGLQIHVREWEEINHGVSVLYDLEEGRDSSIYSDWIDAFTLFGLFDRSLKFADMARMTIETVDNYRSIFLKWSIPDDVERYEKESSNILESFALHELCQFAAQYDLRIELWK